MGIYLKTPNKNTIIKEGVFSSSVDIDLLSTYQQSRMILGNRTPATNFTQYLDSTNSESSACYKLLTRETQWAAESAFVL